MHATINERALKELNEIVMKALQNSYEIGLAMKEKINPNPKTRYKDNIAQG